MLPSARDGSLAIVPLAAGTSIPPLVKTPRVTSVRVPVAEGLSVRIPAWAKLGWAVSKKPTPRA